jgi:hypothetical protein
MKIYLWKVAACNCEIQKLSRGATDGSWEVIELHNVMLKPLESGYLGYKLQSLNLKQQTK